LQSPEAVVAVAVAVKGLKMFTVEVAVGINHAVLTVQACLALMDLTILETVGAVALAVAGISAA
jgi:hypothetical protein